jgi:hypothetical protein
VPINHYYDRRSLPAAPFWSREPGRAPAACRGENKILFGTPPRVIVTFQLSSSLLTAPDKPSASSWLRIWPHRRVERGRIPPQEGVVVIVARRC